MAEMTHTEFLERPDHWDLPFQGLSVSQCRSDYAFTVVLADAERSFEIRIGEAFRRWGPV